MVVVMMMVMTVMMMVKMAAFNDFHCHDYFIFVFFSKACQLQTICLETELRRLQAEQERTSREEKEKKATLAEKKDEQFERKTEAMVPEREYRAVLQVSQ